MCGIAWYGMVWRVVVIIYFHFRFTFHCFPRRLNTTTIKMWCYDGKTMTTWRRRKRQEAEGSVLMIFHFDVIIISSFIFAFVELIDIGVWVWVGYISCDNIVDTWACVCVWIEIKAFNLRLWLFMLPHETKVTGEQQRGTGGMKKRMKQSGGSQMTIILKRWQPKIHLTQNWPSTLRLHMFSTSYYAHESLFAFSFQWLVVVASAIFPTKPRVSISAKQQIVKIRKVPANDTGLDTYTCVDKIVCMGGCSIQVFPTGHSFNLQLMERWQLAHASILRGILYDNKQYAVSGHRQVRLLFDK